MSPLDVLPWIAATLGLVSFVGAVTVFIKGSADKGTIQTQRDSIEALLEWDRIKTTQITELRAADVAKTTEIETLRNKVDILENVANSGDKIDAMRDAVLGAITEVHTGLGQHNALALERVDNVLASIGTLPKGIAGELAQEIVKAMRSGSG